MNSTDTYENSNDIAIIGMAGRFPKAKNLKEFWEKLRDGIELISFFSDEELIAAGASQEMLCDPNYVKAGAIMDDIEMFDASFFGFSPREAEILDPQHRHFLEAAWEALEDAGYDAERFQGLIGVFAGVSLSNYLLRNIGSNPELVNAMGNFQIGISNDKDFLATRVAYKLNLKGPCLSVQTACSTSLVAVHLACQTLLNGECDVALAGGVSINVLEKLGYIYMEGGISSPDGHCRAFDAEGQGIVGGDGLGVVVLKRLDQAVDDGDNIHAVIKGSAINNDGSSKIGYTAPGVDGQSKVIAEAHAMAGVDADTITFVEAHGTGTKLGDPIEIAALTQSFRASTDKKGFCAIGSVKTNLGHLDAAAGVVGLIKTVLSLKHKMIPPTLNFKQPNPEIDFDNSPFYVNTLLSEWKAGRAPRRAGVSSFGIGGTNAHVVLEEAHAVESSGKSRPWQLLLLSAKTPTSLEKATANLAAYLKENPDVNLSDVAYTLQVGRRAFEYRRSVVCRSVSDAVKALEGPDHTRVLTGFNENQQRSVVFMFSGQGTQYPNMTLELYVLEPIFRQQVDHCSELLKPHLGLDLRDLLYPGESGIEDAAERLRQTVITQPALFVIEYAMARLLMNWGLSPEALIGHSIGEYVAACLAGVFSLEDALRIVAERGRLMQQAPPGSMLSVRLSEKDVEPLLGDELSLAAINGPTQSVIAGPAESIDALKNQLDARGVSCTVLQTSHAFHSRMMDPICESFAAKVGAIKLNSPSIPFISNVTGTWITATEATDPRYWASHIVRTVNFAKGAQELLSEPTRILLEVGPGQTLSALAKRQHKQAASQVVLSSIRSPGEAKSDMEFLLGTLGRYWMAGGEVTWSGFYDGERRHRMSLPTYPFERSRYWVEPGKGIEVETMTKTSNAKLPDNADWLYAPLWRQSIPCKTVDLRDKLDRGSSWLVFVDGCGLGSQIIKRLQQQGQSVTGVFAGEKFMRLRENAYTLNPRDDGDYDKLVAELKANNATPEYIIHLWSVVAKGQARTTGDYFERAQERGLYSLLSFVQSLQRQGITSRAQIEVVSSNIQQVNGAETLCPERATILAACKAIPQEYPNITCRSIDIDNPEQSLWQERFADQLIAEVVLDSHDLVVAYRGSRRWVEVFEPVGQMDEGIDRLPLRKGGVYLITGGLGRIGLTFAEHLAHEFQAKIILTQRSAFPRREDWDAWLLTHDTDDEVSCKIWRLLAIEAVGSEALIASADVADKEQMQKVIDQAYDRFGQLNGVVHAAGNVARESMLTIQETDRFACHQHFQAKAHGVLALEEVLQDRSIDFCILMSSLSTVLGGLGFLSAAASNLFMDCYASRRNQSSPALWTSVIWDSWKFSKEAPDALAPETDITPKEGWEVFQRVLCLPPFTPVVVSTRDLRARIAQWVNLESMRDKGATQKESSLSFHPRPNLQNQYVAPRNELESKIVDVWQSLLGIEPVGVFDNLFDLGGDSLLIVQIISRMRESLQVEIPLRSVFDAPTVAELAKSIEDINQVIEQDVEEIAKALDMVEQLSEDELKALFAHE